MTPRFFNLLFFSLSVSLLLGCQGINPVVDTSAFFFQSKLSSSKGTFAPGFEYLEVEWQSRKTALALGYRYSNGSQVVEHWYSGQGEMVKLINGRMVQVNGMTREIRNTSSNLPSWSEVLSHRLPTVWSQTKDTMPGYRFGLQEFVISQQLSPSTAEARLLGEAAQWVLEEVKSKQISGQTWIYQQKFAIQNNRVLYSEQCVAYDMCFKLKPLGVLVSK